MGAQPAQRVQFEPLSFGEQLRTLRRGLELSQVELAAACGISQTRISELERGRALPGLRDFSRLRRVVPLDLNASLRAALLTFEANAR
tara:strand:- start:1895 stop:2158 length:264 start_codon:yes stop_codon:yes gene_type:complete